MPLGLKEFASAEYPENKSDLFAMFIERAIGLATPNGHVSMVTMHNWMFLSSSEPLRTGLINGVPWSQ